MPASQRDHHIDRLAELARLAARGWMEALPTRVTEQFDHYSIRRQKLLVHDIEAEVALILTSHYPPNSYVDEANG